MRYYTLEQDLLTIYRQTNNLTNNYTNVDLVKNYQKINNIYLRSVVRGRKGEYKDILSYKEEVLKIKIDNVLYDIEKSPNLDKKLKHVFPF